MSVAHSYKCHSSATAPQFKMKSVLVLCVLIGLTSANPAEKINVNDLCQGMASYFNVLAMHTDFDVKFNTTYWDENNFIEIHFNPVATILGSCSLVNTGKTLGLEITALSSLAISINNESYNVSQCQVKLNYAISSFPDSVRMKVVLAEIVSLGAVKSGAEDLSAYGETFIKPYLNDAFTEYAKKHWSFDVDLNVGDTEDVETALQALLQASLAKVARQYL